MQTIIAIVSHSHICRNPRVLKEAILLSASYKVIVLTAIHSHKLYQEDLVLIKGENIDYQFYADLRSRNLTALYDKVVLKLFSKLQRFLGFESRYTLGYGGQRLKEKCRRAKASLYIMHQELPTVIGCELLRENYNVAFDFEDWYSQDLLPESRRWRPLKLLQDSEAYALRNASFVITTSSTLAEKLSAFYSCPMPGVIYNVFPTTESNLSSESFKMPVRLFWFSQTVGKGRGIEEFIQTINKLKVGLELHVLGSIYQSYRSDISDLLSANHRIHFHDLVDERDLPSKISSFDIGLALEKTEPLSRNYTITNKFFQYIQAGLPIISTETCGQIEVFSRFRPGYLLPQHPDVEQIAALEQWLTDPKKLAEAKNNAVLTSKHYNWEIESNKLSAIVNKAINNGR